MIHIDDLIRQRLSGAEEAERPGAWLGMKELLDKRMPVETIAHSYNWRRLLGYGAAILLIASFTLGGYKLYESTSSLNTENHTAITVAGSDNSSRRAPLNSPATPATSGVTAQNPEPASAGDHPVSLAGSHAGRPAGNAPAGPHPKANAHSSRTARHPGTSMAALQPAAGSANTGPAGESPRPTRVVASAVGHGESPAVTRQNLAEAGLTAPAGDAGNSTIAGNKNLAEQAAVRTTPQPHHISANHQPERLSAGTARPTLMNASLPATAANAGLQPAAGTALHAGSSAHGVNRMPSTGTAGRTTAPSPGRNRSHIPAGRSPQDTIQMLELVQHRVVNPETRKSTYRLDTIARTYVVVDRPDGRPEKVARPDQALVAAPARKNRRNRSAAQTQTETVPASTLAAARPGTAVPNAAASATATENADNNLVSLSQFRVSSTRTRHWDPERYNEMVRNFKFNLAKVQLYAGITGGMNAAVFTPNSFMGFQLGLHGMMVLNERWSMMAELKYFQRFNTGNAIRDDYTRIDQDHLRIEYATIGGQPVKQYFWSEDAVDHYYNFSTMQSLELPVSLRYTFGRFIAEAGLNFMYGFGMNVEEVEVAHNNPTQQQSDLLPASVDFKPVTADEKQVQVGDFNARMGMGYLLGLGYQCSPAIQVNLRMTQEFWDNASTPGAGMVSRQLYRTPSMQLSIGYRFSQRPR